MKKLFIASLIYLCAINAHAMIQKDIIRFETHGEDTDCKVEKNCYLKGLHDLQITNDSDQAHHYGIHYKVCAKFNDCDVIYKNVEVSAHSHFHDNLEHSRHTKYYSKGHFKYDIETIVDGNSTYEENKTQANVSIK